MIIKNTGKIIDGLYMVGTSVMPVYLLEAEKPAIFDAGLAFFGKIYADGIRQILGRRNPQYCFLTHSHFDHCGSVSGFKNEFSNLKVLASARAKNVLGRPNAIALIRKLTRANEKLARKVGFALTGFARFEPFDVDVILKEGDSIELSAGLTVQVFETPGHTRDCLSYFIPEKKVLFCSEAAGVPDLNGYIVSEALVDFDLYYESMRRLSQLDVEVLCLGHRQAITGRDAHTYFQKSMAHCRDFFNLVASSLTEEGNDVRKVVARIKALQYDPIKGPKQSEPAYLLNLEAKVKAIQRRIDNRSNDLKIPN